MRSFALLVLLVLLVLDAAILAAPARAGQPISGTEDFGDPFFQLVLKDDPAAVDRLDDIFTRLQPEAANRRRAVFVVDEKIADPDAPRRRSVVAFEGFTNGVPLTGSVMLSTFFDRDSYPTGVDGLEVWGWDSGSGVYNFYRFADGTWQFEGSSRGVDLLSDAERERTCFRCHLNGAPIMKELRLPWNNWRSARNEAPYLREGSPGAWPVASQEPIRSDLGDAEVLEQAIASSIRRLNQRRIKDLTQGSTVVDARRLLRPLFDTTEFNLVSSRQGSGMHPPADTGPAEPVVVPGALLVNVDLLGGNSALRIDGLELVAARKFGELVEVQPAEYADLVRNARLAVGAKPGDAVFAWFVPAASFVDNDLVDQLLKQRIISREFAAAVLAIDLETPIFSNERARLLDFVPATFTFESGSAHPDALTRAVIAAIEARGPEAGSAEADFLALLRSPDPVGVLESRLESVDDRIRTALEDPATRGAELERLFELSIERRRAILDRRRFSNLVEAAELLPLPRP